MARLAAFVAVSVLAPCVSAFQSPQWLQSPVNGHWYARTLAVTTWDAAEALAVSFGGHLATVRSATENAWIVTTLATGIPLEGLWIGYTDQALEGTWQWTSGELTTYTNWALGEPNDAGPGEDAAIIANSGAWTDGNQTNPTARGVLELVSPDCDGNQVPDEYELALGIGPKTIALEPKQAPAGASSAVTLASCSAPDGPAILQLGDTAYPVQVAQSLAQFTLLPLSGYADSDVILPARLEWIDGQGQAQGTAWIENAFTYIVPKWVASYPPSGPFDAATPVLFALSDSSLSSGIGSARFGDAAPQPAFAFTLGDVLYVNTIAPAQPAPGDFAVELELHSGNLTEHVLFAARSFIYLGPGLSALEPTSGPQVGGTAVHFELFDFQPGMPICYRSSNVTPQRNKKRDPLWAGQ